MRTTWLTLVVAALGGGGMIVEPATAGPAGMAANAQRAVAPTPARPAQAPPAPARSATVPPAAPVRIAAAPSARISPLRNPVKYFVAAISETPVATALGSKAEKQPAGSPIQQMSPQDGNSMAVPTGPASPELLISLAQSCEQQGDVAQARHHYQTALMKWPGHVDVLRKAARMEDRLGQLPLAESLYAQAVAANPQNASAVNDLGLCLARQGKLQESVQALEGAIHLQPDKALYRNNVATVLVLLREDKRALAHLSAVHRPAEAQFNMGQLLVSRGRATEARPYFEAALLEDPQMEAASFALGQLDGQQAPQQAPTHAATQPQNVAEEGAGSEDAQAVGQQQEPQLGPQFGPVMGYPTEARTPGFGRSTYVPTYVPPVYQPPGSPAGGPAVGPYSLPNVPMVGQAAPAYRTPVGGMPANVRR